MKIGASLMAPSVPTRTSVRVWAWAVDCTEMPRPARSANPTRRFMARMFLSLGASGPRLNGACCSMTIKRRDAQIKPSRSLRRRTDLHCERRHLFVGPEGTRRLVLHRRQRFPIQRDRARGAVPQLREVAPRHDRREFAPVWPLARANGGHDLLDGPIAESRVL